MIQQLLGIIAKRRERRGGLLVVWESDLFARAVLVGVFLSSHLSIRNDYFIRHSTSQTATMLVVIR